MTKDIINSDGKIIIYTDGSAHDEGTTGAAYVIESQGEDDHYVTAYGEKVGSTVRSASLYAETMAIVYALEETPENSNIIIKTDEGSLATFTGKSEEDRNEILEEMDESKVLQALQRLNQAITRHEHVTAEHISHKNTHSYQELRMTRMAHNAAAEHAGVKSGKHIPHRNPEYDYRLQNAPAKDFAESVRNHDSSRSMDVFDSTPDDDELPFQYSSGTNEPQP